MNRLETKKRIWPLKWKFALVYIACVVLPLGIAFAFFYTNSVDRLKLSHLEANRAMLEQVRRDLAIQMELARSAANGMFGDLRLAETLEAEPLDSSIRWDDRRMIDAVLLGYRNAHWELSEIVLFHDNPYLFRGGRLQFISSVKGGDNAWPEILRNVRATMEVRMEWREGDAAIFLVRALDGSKDIYHKVLRMKLDMSKIDQTLRNRMVGQTNARLQLIGPDGKVYAESPDQVQTERQDSTVQEEILARMENPFPETSLLEGWKLQAVVLGSDLLEDVRMLRARFLQLLALCTVIATGAMVIFARSITRRLTLLVRTMRKSENKRLIFVPIQRGSDEISQTMHQYNRMAEQTNTLIDEVYRLGVQKNAVELERTRTELMSLQAQVNPHFLYNVLNTIQSKCLLRDETETASVVQSLARLFRRMVASGDDFVSLREELSVIREYLLIQQYRFEERLTWEIIASQEILSASIPKMIVQILVENASVHGIERMRGQGRILVRIRAGSCIFIRVSDNGVGMSGERLAWVNNSELAEKDTEQMHLGLANIRQRLDLYYGNQARMRVRSREGVGTTVTLCLPPHPLPMEHPTLDPTLSPTFSPALSQTISPTLSREMNVGIFKESEEDA